MTPAEMPKKWDHESDVVIIGGGTGGLPAAIIVTEAGQKATILESRPQCGGSFGMVVGAFAIAGSDEQKAQGIDDSPERFCQDLIRVCNADPEIAKAFADNQIDAYNMLKRLGVKWPGLLSRYPPQPRLQPHRQSLRPLCRPPRPPWCRSAPLPRRL